MVRILTKNTCSELEMRRASWDVWWGLPAGSAYEREEDDAECIEQVTKERPVCGQLANRTQGRAQGTRALKAVL